MKTSILIPTDFSGNALSALEYAQHLYSDKSCTFYLLHAWTADVASSRTYITSKYISTIQDATRKELNAFKTKIEANNTNPNHTFETIFTTKSLREAIEIVVDKYAINFLFMGTKGVTKSSQIIFGSNTVNVIKRIKSCPVVVIPDAYEYQAPKNIGFATDYNRKNGKELAPLKELAAIHQSEIKIAHIGYEDQLTELQNTNLTRLKDFLNASPISLYWMPDETSKTDLINQFINDEDINFLTLINYEHSFIENLLNEPVIKNVGSNPTIPLLIIPYEG